MFLKEACTPRKSVFNKERRDVVLDLSDLLESKMDLDKFFEENLGYIFDAFNGPQIRGCGR